MAKAAEIDQLDLSTANEIYTWLVPANVKTFVPTDSQKKAQVRTYLRENKLTPHEALVKIEQSKAGMPQKHRRW